MGIQGLLPALKSIITPVHVRSYAGKRAAIDTYSWLHKAAFSCSREVCEGRPTDKLVEYCMHRVNLLRHFGVQPVMVFDGGVLPMKAGQEEKRARVREEHLGRAQEHERMGNRSAAFECYQRAVDITPTQALRLIKVLQREGVEYVVSPYEADAQMAYLSINGHVDVIITEDSDLIAYGCPRIFFKMDKSGQGEEFQYGDLVRNRDLNFGNFTKEMVLEMFVMTGCDYLPSLPGMGVKKAHRLMRRFKSYQKVIRHLRFTGLTISAQYEELFQRALLTFRHQRVYDPVGQQMVHLTDVPDDVTVDLEFVGPDLPQELVKAIALGDVDPSTNLPFQECPAVAEPTVSKFGMTVSQKFVAKKEIPAQKNVLTNYFFSELGEARRKQFKAPRAASFIEGKAESRLVSNTSDSVAPENGEQASISEAYPISEEIFGTPLPDDDDNTVSGAEEAHNNVAGFKPGGRISRRTGGLQDFRAFEVFSFSSIATESATTTDWLSEKDRKQSIVEKDWLSEKDRKQSIVESPPVKVSGYFTSSLSLPKKSSVSHDADCRTSQVGAELKDGESCSRRATKKSRIDPGESMSQKLEIGSSPLAFEIETPVDDASHSTAGSGERRSCSIENWDRLADFVPSIGPRERGSSEVGKFSTNVSHVQQFANIGRKSVDKFAETMESFRWSAKGARASGLRAPMTTISTNTSTRVAASCDLALNKFAYQASSFKPPRTLNYSHPRGATTGTVRAHTNAPRLP